MLLDAFGKSSQTKSSKGHPNQPHLYLESSLHASVQVPSQSSDEALVSSSLPLDCFQSLVKKRTDSGSTWNVKKPFGLLRGEAESGSGPMSNFGCVMDKMQPLSEHQGRPGISFVVACRVQAATHWSTLSLPTTLALASGHKGRAFRAFTFFTSQWFFWFASLSYHLSPNLLPTKRVIYWCLGWLTLRLACLFFRQKQLF